MEIIVFFLVSVIIFKNSYLKKLKIAPTDIFLRFFFVIIMGMFLFRLFVFSLQDNHGINIPKKANRSRIAA